jgi:hypothetical protein
MPHAWSRCCHRGQLQQAQGWRKAGSEDIPSKLVPCTLSLLSYYTTRRAAGTQGTGPRADSLAGSPSLTSNPPTADCETDTPKMCGQGKDSTSPILAIVVCISRLQLANPCCWGWWHTTIYRELYFKFTLQKKSTKFCVK